MAGNRHKVFHSQWFMGAVVIAVLLWIGGNVQLFSQTTTQDEANETLAKLEIHSIPASNVSMPEFYTTPGGYPEILINPTLEIVNGKTAREQSRQNVPLHHILDGSRAP